MPSPAKAVQKRTNNSNTGEGGTGFQRRGVLLVTDEGSVVGGKDRSADDVGTSGEVDESGGERRGLAAIATKTSASASRSDGTVDGSGIVGRTLRRGEFRTQPISEKYR